MAGGNPVMMCTVWGRSGRKTSFESINKTATGTARTSRLFVSPTFAERTAERDA